MRALALFLGLTLGCSSSTPPATKPTAKVDTGLDKLMRDRMNKSYSQLVYMVFHAEGAVDFPKISIESAGLREAVGNVRKLQMPQQVTTDEARSVYVSYNDKLQRDADRLDALVTAKDHDQLKTLVDKIGRTCNDCHHFFRVKIDETKTK